MASLLVMDMLDIDPRDTEDDFCCVLLTNTFLLSKYSLFTITWLGQVYCLDIITHGTYIVIFIELIIIGF